MTTRAWLVAILATYASSLALPAFGRSGHGSMPGICCLILLPFVLIYPAWWANPLFFAGCVCLGRGKTGNAFVFGVSAMALAMSFGLMMGATCDYNVGYLAWIASMTGLTVAAGCGVGHREFTPGKVAAVDGRDLDSLGEPIHDAPPTSGPGDGSSSSSASASSAPLSSRSPS